MNTRHKILIRLLVFIQFLVIFKIFPEKVFYRSYSAEIVSSIFFSITKINRLYNFFTGTQDPDKYSYTTNNIYMVKGEGNNLKKLPISTTKDLVYPFNSARISGIPSMATQDTTLYNAVVRSEALFFFKKYREYPLIYFEVLTHHCAAQRTANKFVKSEKVDTVYSSYFSLD